MGYLVEEVRRWNTPAVGAYLLWRFTQGYCNGHSNGDAPIGLLHFVASAILTNNELLEPISDRRNDIQSYIRSFEDKERSDLLLSLHNQVKGKREYTLASIDIAITTGLLVWDANEGKLYPRNIEYSTRGKALKSIFQKKGKQAEILGQWMSKHDLATISRYLKVVF